jgi:type II secretory pathway pseudopilin PulG
MRHDSPPRHPAARRSGFTLIEILVVVTIIIALLGILLGAMGPFTRAATIAATKQFEGQIIIALGAYQLDFGDYPPSTGVTTPLAFGSGGEILCGLLVAPSASDGKTGFGFAINSKVYGPYLTIKNDNTIINSGNGGLLTMASSPGRKPFMYYSANLAGARNDMGQANPIWGGNGVFNTNDNGSIQGEDPTTYLNAASTSLDTRKSLSSSLRTAKFLISQAGPDDKNGTDDDVYLPGP